jgi:hypothetical protein
VFGRLAGYEDVNDAERLARDPTMRAIIGREGLERLAASSSQIGRFETEWLASDANLAALMDLPADLATLPPALEWRRVAIRKPVSGKSRLR